MPNGGQGGKMQPLLKPSLPERRHMLRHVGEFMLCKATPAPVLTGFGPGTLIDTAEGPVPVEWLSRGHKLITRRGLEPMGKMRRISAARCAGALVQLDPSLLGSEYDAFPLLISARQRLLLRGDDIGLHFGFDTVLAEARHLQAHPDINEGPDDEENPIFELMLRAGTVIRANGIWVEASHAELQGGRAAYPCLADWECQLILAMRGQFNAAGRDGYQAVA
jgi:hypothetical protein